MTEAGADRDGQPPSTIGEGGWINVALSGGGHRATAWGIGAVAGLVQLGLAPSVASVASVSGGSIANGAIATGEQDLRTMTSLADLAGSVRQTLRVVAVDGLFPFGPHARSRTVTALAITGLALLLTVCLPIVALAATREQNPAWYGLALAAIVLILLLRFGASLFASGKGLLTALGGLVLSFALGAGAAALTGFVDGRGAAMIIAGYLAVLVVAWVLAARLLAGRGRIVQQALDEAFGWGTKLKDIDSSCLHLFCATSLQSGDQLYLSQYYGYGYREGLYKSAPSMVSVAEAVQASACLPVAFPPAMVQLGTPERDPRIDEPPADEPRDRAVLVDGGVYDNMGDQWASDFDKRAGYRGRPLSTAPAIKDSQQQAHGIIVANASAPWTWNRWTARRWLSGELQALDRDQTVQYDQTTAQRRRSLVRRFVSPDDPLHGVVAQISTSPVGFCRRALRNDDPAVVARGEAAAQWVESMGDQAEWAERADKNAAVKTTLAAIGIEDTERLILQAAVLVIVGLHIYHDVPLPDGPFDPSPLLQGI